MLHGKKILLGICGSIAAYKAAFLTRLLVKKGAIVRVIMTEAATQFISPLTLSTLSKHPVTTHFFTSQEQVWNNHVELGLWADAFLIAPITGATLAKLANGLCDNVLTATYLSARCPVYLAPAMDLDMWQHPATQRNVNYLQSIGNKIIPVGDGELASGLVGKGRLAEPEDIVQFLQQQFTHQVNQKQLPLHNKKVILTAGPTREPIDPVRFISNHSTGRMGIELAEAAHQQGAKVTLILGATPLRPPTADIEVICVQTAQEMYAATVARFEQADIGILTAAVADYTPAHPQTKKIKKQAGTDDLTLSLKRTKDILKHLGTLKQSHQTLVGFALETDNELANATRKLQAKNLDFIVLNSLQDKGAGFQHATNKVTIIDKNGTITPFDLKSKREVAEDIIAYITAKYASLFYNSNA